MNEAGPGPPRFLCQSTKSIECLEMNLIMNGKYQKRIRRYTMAWTIFAAG
jgi:hypothetical protein